MLTKLSSASVALAPKQSSCIVFNHKKQFMLQTCLKLEIHGKVFFKIIAFRTKVIYNTGITYNTDVIYNTNFAYTTKHYMQKLRLLKILIPITVLTILTILTLSAIHVLILLNANLNIFPFIKWQRCTVKIGPNKMHATWILSTVLYIGVQYVIFLKLINDSSS